MNICRCSVLLIAIVVGLVATSCTGEVIGVPDERGLANTSVENGRRLIANFGCGSCHSIPGVPGADAMAAPPLNDFYQRMVIAGRLPNTADNLASWIQNPQGIDPETAMPNLGVTPLQARDIAAYLYHEQNVLERINR
jgi:cytochrome c